jgi:serine/threonine protein kinase
MICNKYKLTSRIGNGSFGEIYKGINVRTGEEV